MAFSLLCVVGGCSAVVRDSYWDCQFRQLAVSNYFASRNIMVEAQQYFSLERTHYGQIKVVRGYFYLPSCKSGIQFFRQFFDFP